MTLAGAFVGFVAPAPVAWNYLSMEFVDGRYERGFLYFMAFVLGGCVMGGATGLAVGNAVGWVWERAHTYRRRRRMGARTDEAGSVETKPPLPPAASPRATGTRAAVAVSDAPAIRYDDTGYGVDAFLQLARSVWPRDYDRTRSSLALGKTINIGAWDGARLVGSVRVLTDGYLFATIPDVFVEPAYRRRGIGRELMRRALAVAPQGTLFFGAQRESVGFFERLGCERGPVGFVLRAPAMRTAAGASDDATSPNLEPSLSDSP